MENQNTQENQESSENSSFYDQADGSFNKAIKSVQSQDGTVDPEKLSKGVTADQDGRSGSTYSKNLMADPDSQVRATEDASLQDDSYSFDESNTDNEEYHDVDDSDFDLDNDDDFVQ
jgi:hypothetical protein